ncbi:hypothetical protein JW930_00145 [Candidatus Woesearchaeota archaeon]|nr:hypothetical protein [Candidatus Woesearchaeota archaeon]
MFSVARLIQINMISHLLMIFMLVIISSNFFNPTNFDFFLLFLGGWLIDIDHVLYHLITEKNLSKKEFRKIHTYLHKFNIPRFYLFHTIEFLLLLLFINRYYLNISYFIVGYVSHLVLDSIGYIMYYKNLKWIRHWTIFYYLAGIKNKYTKEKTVL